MVKCFDGGQVRDDGREVFSKVEDPFSMVIGSRLIFTESTQHRESTIGK